jgi:putative intracellular protease/amidase
VARDVRLLAREVTCDRHATVQDEPMNRDVLFPLPDADFDVTEVAVPWKLLTQAGYRVVFATEDGATPACDPLLIGGVIFGKLGAKPEAIAFYRELEQDASFRAPIKWRDIDPTAFAGLFLAGGHAPGMKQYLGSALLRDKLAAFWELGRPVGAICHGVLPLARAGVLAGRRTTCLPKYMERGAYLLTFWKLGKYYRTYDAYVEDEVRAAGPEFIRGHRFGDPFVVEDGNYVSARWPGDSYLLAQKMIANLESAHV